MRRSIFIKLTKENKGSRRHATWARNHVSPWASFKTTNRRLARRRLKRITNQEIIEDLSYAGGENL